MRTENNLRRALRARLDPIALSPSDEQRMLSRMKGEKSVIKKRWVPVLALLLVLLSLTALAVSNWESIKGYLDTVRDMDASGELARWSDEDKLKLLSAMSDAGLVARDDRLTIALDEARPLAERAAQADALIAERYGDAYFDRYTVEQIELSLVEMGESEQKDYEKWNQENLLKYYDPDGVVESIDETHLYYETAKLLTATGRFPAELIREVKVSGEWTEEDMTRRWVVTVSIDKALYRAKVGDGTNLTDFDAENYSFEQDGKLCFRYFLDEGGYFLGKDDLSYTGLREKLALDDALPLAEQALLMRLNLESMDELRSLTLEAFYGDSGVYDIEGGRFRTSCNYMYRDAEGRGVYLAEIDALTGEVLCVIDYAASEVMREQEKAWLSEIREQLRAAGVSDDLYNQDRQYFWDWTIAEKAAWSAVARPIVQKYIDEHPEYAQYLIDLSAHRYAQHTWDNLISLTRFAYGVPGDQALSQEEAYAIAYDESLRMGANERYLKDSTGVSFYYDVTDPARPVWKVRIRVTYGAMDLNHPYVPTMPDGYFTVMDAHTGDIVEARPYDVNTENRDVV